MLHDAEQRGVYSAASEVGLWWSPVWQGDQESVAALLEHCKPYAGTLLSSALSIMAAIAGHSSDEMDVDGLNDSDTFGKACY